MICLLNKITVKHFHMTVYENPVFTKRHRNRLNKLFFPTLLYYYTFSEKHTHPWQVELRNCERSPFLSQWAHPAKNNLQS